MKATQFRLFALIILLVAFAACTDYDHDTPNTAANLADFEHWNWFLAMAIRYAEGQP